MADKAATTLLVTPYMTLLGRELVRFARHPVRVWSFVIAPLFLAIAASAGLGEGVVVASMAEGQPAAAFFFPSLVLLAVVFTAVNVPGSVIEDRRDGFMQAVLISPISYSSIVFAKVSAGSILALAQSCLLVLFAPLIGLRLTPPGAAILVVVLAVAGFSFAALGFLLAWLSDSAISFYWAISIVVLPFWVLGGGMTPLPEQSWLAPLAACNPVRHYLDLSRSAFSLGPDSARDPGALMAAALSSPGFLTCLVFASVFLLTGYLLLRFRVRTAL